MAHLVEAMKAGVKGFKEGMAPRDFVVAGKAVTCPHCGGRRFARGKAQLNSSVATLIGLDWTDPTAHLLICTTCSRIEWFTSEPDEADAE